MLQHEVTDVKTGFDEFHAEHGTLHMLGACSVAHNFEALETLRIPAHP
jgi:hypothetical protein